MNSNTLHEGHDDDNDADDDKFTVNYRRASFF